MNKMLLLIVLVLVLAVGWYYVAKDKERGGSADTEQTNQADEVPVSVTPIEHATAVLSWNNTTLYLDPVGGGEAFANQPEPDIVFITDTHGDHLNIETLGAVVIQTTAIIAPQAVADELPETLRAQTHVLANGESLSERGFTIRAIPMYNLPESDDAYHVKGHGNGYIIERDGYRVYVAGDTEGTPEMRALSDIDMAFVPMNLPYTMSVDDAADAVLAFAPERVYPYHYRGQDGLSDVGRFKELVTSANSDINVLLLDWYPNQ